MNVLVFKSRVIGKAWINIETDNREVARNILPPACCANATIVRPNKFTMAKNNFAEAATLEAPTFWNHKAWVYSGQVCLSQQVEIFLLQVDELVVIFC